MSTGTAKVTRRELRKAFGPEACLAVEDHDQKIQLLTASANHTHAKLTHATLRLDEQAAKMQAHSERLAGLEAPMPWRRRLRWLVTGR